MKKLLFTVFVVCLLALPTFSKADEAQDQQVFGGKPLMTIRFNQQNVYYQIPLYRAVKKALDVYPNASFQIVSVIPTTGDYKTDNKSALVASEYASLVGSTLNEMGLPSTRVRTNYTSDSANSYHEVRIFVR